MSDESPSSYSDDYCATNLTLISTSDRTHAPRTRELDPKHLELKHKTTRKTATHERTPDRPHAHTHIRLYLAIGDRCVNQQTSDDTDRLTVTLSHPTKKAKWQNLNLEHQVGPWLPAYNVLRNGLHTLSMYLQPTYRDIVTEVRYIYDP